MNRDDASLLDALRFAQALEAQASNLSVPDLEIGSPAYKSAFHDLIHLAEALSRVSPEYKSQHPEIPWKTIKDLRNILVHSYDMVDMQSLYIILKKDVSELVRDLSRLTIEIPDA